MLLKVQYDNWKISYINEYKFCDMVMQLDPGLQIITNENKVTLICSLQSNITVDLTAWAESSAGQHCTLS